MAVVWAKSNGNWTDTTLWAFWNETTQQIEDYGQIPQADDVIYCNSYTITVNDIPIINVNSINNSQNPHTGNSSGRLNKTSGTSIRINANINAISQIVNYAVNSSRSIIIYGDVFSTGPNALVLGAFNNFSCYINGNVTINGAALIDDGQATGSLTITGNVISESSSISYFGVQGGNSKFTVTVNGNVSDVYYHTTNNGNIYINGVFTSHTNTNLQAANLTINGGIEYVATNYKNGGVTPNNLLGTIYFWRDITPNSNAPFQRVTKYQLDNTNQYPTPANVRIDVPYAWGELVGTYQQPPESVVLKDYVYDNGDKVGTLENEVIVDNTNTINVYPYKKRCN